MEANIVPERPSKVTFAIYVLYTSLGIGVIMVLVTWLLFGSPGPVGYFLITYLMHVSSFHFQTMWVMHGDVVIVPIAAWLFYMIGKGKNWARMTLLVFVILETLVFALSLLMIGLLPRSGFSPLSLSGFLIDACPTILQHVLQVVAVTLLFGRVSSNWFKAMKASNRKPRTTSRTVKVAVALLALLIAVAVFWQLAPWSQDRALMEAIRQNHVAQVQDLLAKGADINAKDTYGVPALMWAAAWGRLQIVKLLLEKGADVNAKDKVGQTALMLTRQGGADLVRLLLDKGADINTKDKAGHTALMSATRYGQADVMEVLLNNGADVNAKDNYGRTALMTASWSGGRPEVVKLLLDKGADVNAEDQNGQTALTLASEKGHTEIVELLKAHGAKE
ncbi:MAG TPA: ankyrin repeat domain-containing protein [Desulfomonilaceae bacterium]|nr:ankyrin repeat domain-containing protein [Desulfomonilaceae bacterium]